MKKYVPYIVLVAFIVVFDQYTKWLVVNNLNLYQMVPIIPGFLDFTHTRNTGIAFSLGGDLSPMFRMVLFKILPVGICFWIVSEFKKEFNQNKILTLAYTLILGGAIGNIIDRIRLDYVVDFISVYSNGFLVMPPWRFAIFNIADSAVSIGAFLLLLNLLMSKKKASQNNAS